MTTPENPMLPTSASTRRRFLTVAAGAAAVVTVPAVATPIRPAVGSALSAAARQMEAALARWKAACAAVGRAMARVEQWEVENPKPASKRGLKRWKRSADRVRYSAEINAAWCGQIEAENAYRAAQKAVAGVEAANTTEMVFKAALAALYDAEKLASGADGIIAYGVAWDVVRLAGPEVMS